MATMIVHRRRRPARPSFPPSSAAAAVKGHRGRRHREKGTTVQGVPSVCGGGFG